MEENVKMIKYLLLMLVGTMLLTYAVYLNMENGWLVFNTKWMSNTFILAILCGVSSSIIVTLFIEIRSYFVNKRKVLMVIFDNVLTLYSYFQVYYYNLMRSKSSCNDGLSDKIIDYESIDKCACNILNAGYCPYFADSLLKLLMSFRSDYYQKIQSLCLNTRFISIAMITDKLNLSKEGRYSDQVTYLSPKTHIVIDKLINEVIPLIELVDSYAFEIATFCSRQKDWNDYRRTIVSYEQSYKEFGLEEYIKG